jgi:hypothetical protein
VITDSGRLFQSSTILFVRYRRLRGDMTETFKIVTEIYDKCVTEDLLPINKSTFHQTRGHSLKLTKNICVVLRWTFSIASMSLVLYGFQTLLAYSRIGLTSDLNNKQNVLKSKYLNDTGERHQQRATNYTMPTYVTL